MSVVVSVNVGMPRDIQWDGKTVRTAIWKQPTAGRVTARRLNLVGDGQGDLKGHGGEQRAVMVYQLDSYRYWQPHLGRSELEYGFFGENLTVEGLADNDVCIGDRFRIGTALFEVTQPRVTCYRVGIRTGYPALPALLVSHHRPGFYFRVIEEGDIGAGDEIVKIAEGPERMSVADIDSLLYSSAHPIESLQRALRIPALSVGWQDSFKALLAARLEGKTSGNAGLSSMPTSPLLWKGFRRLRVTESHPESEDVRSFVLAAEDGSPLPAPLPGQYIAIKVTTNPDLPALTRTYSLSGSPAAGTYRISVKREVAGIVSGYLHTHTHIGDILEVGAPRGTFTLSSSGDPLVLLSAGVGATPLLAMLHASADTKTSVAREIWWLHGARDAAHRAFADETRALLGSLQLAHWRTLFSRPATTDQLGRDYDELGHIDIPLLERLGIRRTSDFYLCGPGEFLRNLTSGLTQWGVEDSHIHSEVFGAVPVPANPGVISADEQTPHLPAGDPGTGPNITFARSGLVVRWNTTRLTSLLELAEACAVPVRWSCRSGVCHTCECALIGGELKYSPDPLDPPAEGSALICCATPLTDIELDL
ncbi:MAG TPA: MOSC and FAD-binding oxidoreductase domain-containing protein [Steroidobacteraceae bacterium]|jgi:ferredoxin-NADP reductase/MOSC domain-containing protein YiiM